LKFFIWNHITIGETFLTWFEHIFYFLYLFQQFVYLSLSFSPSFSSSLPFSLLLFTLSTISFIPSVSLLSFFLALERNNLWKDNKENYHWLQSLNDSPSLFGFSNLKLDLEKGWFQDIWRINGNDLEYYI